MTLDEAVEALEAGQVIGLPTDTVYGLAANPFPERAVERLFSLKGRPRARPVPLLAAGVDQVATVAEVDPATVRVGAEHWPGPLTLVLPRRAELRPWLGDPEAGTIAVRVPDHPTALALLSRTGPLAVTSANRSGEPPAIDDREAEAIFGEAVAGYLPGRAAGGEASTVVDVTARPPVVLRSGPVPWPLE
ncbi:MAG: L-threonylcarbamoyladenylate synthase [Acidimicrobiia bacterium]